MSGYVPFGEDAEDPYEIYEEIIKKEISFPEYFTDQTAKTFALQLLSRIPEMRLGGSYNSLKSHAFFRNLDWVNIYKQNLSNGNFFIACWVYFWRIDSNILT